MKSMQPKKLAVISALLALASMAFVPAALASPINPNLTWNPNPIAQGLTTTATYGVATDSDCPSGQTFAGTLTVVEPDGVSTSSISVGATACGTTNLSAAYPTAFTGVEGTTECGLYAATWSGTTSTTVGGIHPTFSVTNNFIVTCPTGVPQFGMPALLVAAMGLVLVAALRNKRVLKV